MVFSTPTMAAALVAVALSNASVESLRTTAPELVKRMSGLDSDSAEVLVACYAIDATVGLLFFSSLTRRLRAVHVLTLAFAVIAVVLTLRNRAQLESIPTGRGPRSRG